MSLQEYLKTRAQPVTTPSEFPTSGRVSRFRQVKLSENVLLNIFRYYLDVSPQHWPRLAHICRGWRHIVFTSQQALHLRIFCTHGTPVLKSLDCWPALPIVIKYGGSLELDPPAPEDEDNILTALKQSDRVSSISLTITDSLLEKLSAIERPFSELEDLVLRSRDGLRLTLPSTFWWGPHLRCLHSTGTALPGLLELLCSSKNLVDLQLHDVFDCWEFSPEELTDALSVMDQLQSLSLHFPSTKCAIIFPESRGRRAVLPVLTRLNFQGFFRYLERLVARMDVPRLGDIELTFLNENSISFPKLREFVDRIEMHKSHRRAHILTSERAISISFIQPGTPACFKLQLFCESPSEQLLFMTRLCSHLPDSLSHVEDLRTTTTRPLGRGGTGEWRDLLNSFTSAQRFHVAGNPSTNIVRALQLPDRGGETVMPSLHTLYIAQPGPRHAPLREAVVSFMTSRRLSGHPIAVEYEREPRGTEPISQQITIETLSDDVLLNIFRYYLDAAPQTWPMLTYVCQRWRQIVHTSTLGLNLRLFFTPGAPVLKALDCWTALPIIVQYGGVPNLNAPAPEDDDNVIAALKQSGRVNSISLTVTRSLLGKLSAISEPFSELEELVLLSRDSMQLTLPSTFRWGPHLRTLHSTTIAFHSLPQLLSHSHDLVDIQLHEIPSAGYFSPEAFANALSGMTHLRTLSLHFLSFPPRRNHLSLSPQPGERVVLPALMFLKYRGTSKYLDSLVARIDAPGLGDIDITLFSQPTMDASQLGRFIERTGIPTVSQAEIRTSGDAISISFSSPGTSTPLRLQISCDQLDWQLSSMAQVCDQFSPFLLRVDNICINTTQSSSGQDDVDGEQWLELIRAFDGATDFRVAAELTTAILCALGPADREPVTVLPALRYLRVENPTVVNELSWDALQSLITSRLLSGRPVHVNVPSYQCHICRAGFRRQQGLERHVNKHTYRIACSYCDFECTVGHNDLFRAHLASKHAEIAFDDSLVLDPPSTRLLPLQFDGFVNQHSSLRAPDIVAPPSTMVTAPHSQ